MGLAEHRRSHHQGTAGARPSSTVRAFIHFIGKLRTKRKQVSRYTPLGGRRSAFQNQTLWIPLSRHLRRDFSVSFLNFGYLKIYAVSCSPGELHAIGRLDQDQFAQLGVSLRSLIGLTGRLPNVRALCFGHSVRLDELPPALSRDFSHEYACGVSLPRLRAVAIRNRGNVPIRRLLVHELTHVLLSLLSRGFPYLAAIQEGFARYEEHRIEDSERDGAREPVVDDAGGGPDGYLLRDEHMSLRALLEFDWAERDRSGDHEGLIRFRRSCYWLICYLGTLIRVAPRVSGLLSELRTQDLRTPDQVCKWIEDATGMREAELEAEFYLFCVNRDAPEIPPRTVGNSATRDIEGG